MVSLEFQLRMIQKYGNKKKSLSEPEKPKLEKQDSDPDSLSCLSCGRIYKRWKTIKNVWNWKCTCRKFLVVDYKPTKYLKGLQD